MVILVNKEEYGQLVKSKSRNPFILKDAGISFLAGGVLGASFEMTTVVLINLFDLSSKDATGWSLLIFIMLAILLTGFGVFDSLISKFKFGLIIPITGFAHSVMSALLDNKKDGLITGLGSNMFKLAGCVILYGTISAFLFAIVKVIIYG